MTIIAAISDGSRVVMGCDTAADYAGSAIYLADGKIATFAGSHGEQILIGVAGNSSIAAAVRFGLKFGDTPEPDADQAAADSWAHEMAGNITSLLADANPPLLIPADGDGPACLDGTMLLAWRTHLWKIETNSAIRPRPAVAAIGAGTDIALGSLLTSMLLDIDPHIAVDSAARFACTYGSGCRIDDRGPIIYTT